ncbi:MRD1 [[Candida] subhashii]|uniref:Multiple RNA-binding domain-containing protein 1 n=1 Tax=[Candida] subhashii TaxID=561895 RepID=A0A8J5QPR5_9ASCO|nr:MRD1 [[Candida] subhashii]KAG7664163.1 MRD1 [[Candida] subhashii]
MSRLIVKGLPKYYTEDNLRHHFAKQGNVTDVKLMKKRNGESRRFAFIGYKSFEDAEKAARFFNKSFIDTARIDVELAKTFSDPNVPLSFKEKRRRDEDRLRQQEEELIEQENRQNAKKQKIDHISEIDKQIESNPKLREYMEVMKPSHQVKSWANDAIADGSGGPSAKELEEALNKQESGEAVSKVAGYDVLQAEENPSDDEYNDFTAPKDEEDEEEEQMMSLRDLDDKAHDGEQPEESIVAADENVSDLDWLKSRRIRIKENEDGQTVSETPSQEPEESAKQKPRRPEVPSEEYKSPEEQTIEKLQETGRLFIRNILYEATEDDFRNLFEKYGPLEEVHIAIDTRTSKSKGFVYIQFANPSDAVRAFKSLDKQIFQGRLLHILAADKKKDHRLSEFDLKNLPLKKQRDLKKKAQAAKTQFSWNSLYMNSDAVLESVAAKLGIAKSKLIDPENSNSAVKQALAEAHVIGDVRKYFEDRGVDLTSFDKKERDDKVILVKNFPFGTTIDEIGEMFSEYGELKRMLMPPAGTIAIVEFRDAPSARAAFTKLAYRRFKTSILYLEKGPKDLFTREPTANENVVISEEEQQKPAVEAKVTANEILGGEGTKAEEEANVIEGPTVSIFVKNLNFSTTANALSELFKPLSGFVIATVKTKPDIKKPGNTLSMGFGFVEFRTKEQASVAISTLDGHVLDGHKLQLKLSHKQGGSTSASKIKKSNKSSKLIIKNLPFEATRKDLLELFGAFGQLKSVRVPKKFDSSARGFAFVEFNLAKEAENAMTQLEGVHLLGRRLVMQYAEQESEDAEVEIEKMTKKVKKQVATQNLAAARLAGKGKIQLEDEKDEFNDF